jgi:ribosomal protein S18 acetylase RimI-like enzyme
VDIEILVSSMLRAQGFAVSAEVLAVRSEKVVKVDFHPRDILLYTELDIGRGFAYNENFYVNPQCRHRGIGARLLAAHEEICREVQLTILINNNRQPAFWKRQGYRRLNPFWQMGLEKRLGVEFTGQSMYKKP